MTYITFSIQTDTDRIPRESSAPYHRIVLLRTNIFVFEERQLKATFRIDVFRTSPNTRGQSNSDILQVRNPYFHQQSLPVRELVTSYSYRRTTLRGPVERLADILR